MILISIVYSFATPSAGACSIEKSSKCSETSVAEILRFLPICDLGSQIKSFNRFKISEASPILNFFDN
jgi:hypothetical protein